MKIMNIFSVLALTAASFLLAGCADTDAQYTIPTVDSPSLVKTYPAENEVLGSSGDVTITVKYDKRVFFASQDYTKLQLTGGTISSANVYGTDSVLTIMANIPNLGTNCTLNIPAGVVTGPNRMPAPEVTLNFSTKSLPTVATAPVAAKSARATALYNYLLGNYQTNIISGMMANVAWNNDESEQVYEWTGKYPAINGYDYIHLPASWAGSSWINYGDITPVKEWNGNGGIATVGWHWMVPKEQVYVNAGEGASIWSGSIDVDTDWSHSGTVDASVFADIKEGQTITFNFEQNANAEYWQIQIMDGNWSPLPCIKDDVNEYGVIETTAGQTSYSATLTADDVSALQSGGIVFNGYGVTYTGITTGDVPSGKSYASLDVNNDFTYVPGETTFSLTNAVTEGTWENDVVKQDLERVATYLKLLKDTDIPVLWRPLHEASGGWFWWGTDAESFKKLWIMMFDYFKEQGLDNLIWVWTSQGDDDSWYPGDSYVDIIGRDLYGNTVASCEEEYQNLRQKYGKMITLSECGALTNDDGSTTEIGSIADQWAAGATWSWFMPWYKADYHTTQEWWKAVMNMDNVITRDKVSY